MPGNLEGLRDLVWVMFGFHRSFMGAEGRGPDSGNDNARFAAVGKAKALTKRGPTNAQPELKISVRESLKNSPHTRFNHRPRNHQDHTREQETALQTRIRQRAEPTRAQSAKPQSWVRRRGAHANCRRHSSRLFCPALYRAQNKKPWLTMCCSAQEEATDHGPGRIPK